MMAHEMDDETFWNLKISVEVSARYHDWRRSTMETYVRCARGATLLGAIITLATAFNPLNLASPSVVNLVALLAFIIACINLLELVSDLDGRARLHTDLYRRFVALQGKNVQGA
jgi:hypothetical protein